MIIPLPEKLHNANEVENCIARVLKRFHRKRSDRYFHEVHQELAPLARSLELERDWLLSKMNAAIDHYDGLAEIWHKAAGENQDRKKAEIERAQSAHYRNVACLLRDLLATK